jgi:hypothetical protein
MGSRLNHIKNIFIIIITLLSSQLCAQIPTGVEKKYDEFMTEYMKVYDVFMQNDVETAAIKIREMKPGILRKAEAIAKDLEPYSDYFESEEWETKLFQKPYFKKLQEYMTNPEFMVKWQANDGLLERELESIQNELDFILGEDGDDEYEDEFEDEDENFE